MQLTHKEYTTKGTYPARFNLWMFNSKNAFIVGMKGNWYMGKQDQMGTPLCQLVHIDMDAHDVIFDFEDGLCPKEHSGRYDISDANAFKKILNEIDNCGCEKVKWEGDIGDEDEWVDSERIDGYGLKMDEKKFCSECSRGMPEADCGDEDDSERVCDECANETPRPLGTSTPDKVYSKEKIMGTQHIKEEDMNKVLEESLGMDNKESHNVRKSDSLDFSEHHISDLREAISHAYNMGMKRENEKFHKIDISNL